jgi:hypothetical protein
MKRCPYCGGEYPDEATACLIDRQPLGFDILPPVAPPQQIEGPGTAFDVSLIAPQIRRVRQDHLKALRTRPHPTPHRMTLIATALRMISHFPFFHHERSEDEIHNQDA